MKVHIYRMLESKPNLDKDSCIGTVEIPPNSDGTFNIVVSLPERGHKVIYPVIEKKEDGTRVIGKKINIVLED